MSRSPRTERVETVVIGGGQAGLATGYHLKRLGLPFVILDENARIGDAWRNRWDSLRLFTPARYDRLPGLRFPGPRSAYPSKDDVADYLEAYARDFQLPVRTGTRVERLSRDGDRFRVDCGADALLADSVVAATGAYHRPRVPPFADQLDPGIVRLHSSAYRNPSQLQPGGVLVVGAGNSGGEIAIELARDHRVWLSGPDTGQEPARAGSVVGNYLFAPILWFMATRVLTVRTPVGRRVRDHFLAPPRGIPLGRVRRKDFAAAGIERVGRTVGVRDGLPVLDDGTAMRVANVVWCTGLEPDYDWIDIPLPFEYGAPKHELGVVESCPGLYLMGLPFLRSLSSALLGGVGRDAARLARRIGAVRGRRARET